MDHELAGKVVVVAGASSGIGRATAERFAAEGATVVMLARGRERLDEAVALVPGRASGIVCDIADPASVRSAFADVDARFGRVDVLLNVAGAARVCAIADASDEDIATVVGTNFLGPIYTTRSAIPLMRASGGDIVNISSEITLDDMPLMTLYSSTKRGLDGFTRTMTKEPRSEGVRVTLVVMGSVGATSFGESNFRPGDAERAYPVWAEDGYLTRVAAAEHPMEAAWVADTLVHAVTRPRGMMIDVIHTRATGA